MVPATAAAVASRLVPEDVRIALVIDTLDGGGAERVFVTLANYFCQIGCQVDLVLLRRAGPFLAEVDPGVAVINLEARRTLSSLVPLIRYLRRARPAAIMATLAHVNVVAVLAKMVARIPGRLIVRETVAPSAQIRFTNAIRSKVVTLLQKRAYLAADGIVSPSRGVADDLVAAFGIPRDRIAVIANPLDVGRIRALAEEAVPAPCDADGGRPMVLGAGRLSFQKDFVSLIRAFATVIETVPARLLILGEGEDRGELEGLVKQLGLEGCVDLPGFVDNPFACMRQAAVYVLSSRYEGLPNTLLQAMALGVPVVATDCPGGPAEVLDGGRYGRLVPVGDVEALATGILDGLLGRLPPPPPSATEAYAVDRVGRLYLDVLQGECV
ncbi:MAG: glycosyltransferase [Acidobacteriota bacterium]|nr:glycosyltransferase [Acidobacteriota bacterium]